MKLKKENLCAVIVTYNPDISLLKDNIISFCNSVMEFVIIDNNSVNVSSIRSLLVDLECCNYELIENDKNYGIGISLNMALEWAFNKNYEWAITFDQDSSCSSSFFQYIYREEVCEKTGLIYPKLLDKKVAGVFGGSSTNGIEKIIAYIKRHVKRQMEVHKTPITSGSVTNVIAAKSIGGYDPCMFIDGIDFDLDFKLQQNGYDIIECKMAYLYHNLGIPCKRKFCGITITASGHSPKRCYFMNRNSLILFSKYYKYDFKWVTLNIFSSLGMAIRNAIVSGRYKEYFLEVFHGILDGLSGKMKQEDEKNA